MQRSKILALLCNIAVMCMFRPSLKTAINCNVIAMSKDPGIYMSVIWKAKCLWVLFNMISEVVQELPSMHAWSFHHILRWNSKKKILCSAYALGTTRMWARLLARPDNIFLWKLTTQKSITKPERNDTKVCLLQKLIIKISSTLRLIPKLSSIIMYKLVNTINGKLSHSVNCLSVTRLKMNKNITIIDLSKVISTSGIYWNW